MFEELVKAIQSQVKERLISPLMGAFVVSWGLWNYKFLVILFSEESVRRSFQMIDELAYPYWWSFLVCGIVAPLATALIYIFVYPYPAKYVFQFTRKRQRELLEIKREIEDETPLTIEESRRIKRDLAKLEEDFNAQLDKKESEVARLKEEVASLREQNQDGQVVADASVRSEAANVESAESLSEMQLDMLRRIGMSDGPVPQPILVGKGERKIEGEHYLDDLKARNLVSSSSLVYDGRMRPHYRLTPAGRSELIRRSKQG